MTAFGDDIDRKKCLTAGSDGYLRKPVLLTDILKAIINLKASLPYALSKNISINYEIWKKS